MSTGGHIEQIGPHRLYFGAAYADYLEQAPALDVARVA